MSKNGFASLCIKNKEDPKQKNHFLDDFLIDTTERTNQSIGRISSDRAKYVGKSRAQSFFAPKLKPPFASIDNLQLFLNEQRFLVFTFFNPQQQGIR